ncbi:hypothetical protein [Deinococcus enclensis]|uniref:Uncharacterized protein n=1 Tax=Deinococcus enclensis TaxID=1049582 RepID=A0ABT9MIQ5_9DEIO|nr:hypothetical protein [Deinococcus enclensis]MDP9766474.1 hypothetical protein [Deinococcus enclensis]
MDLRAVRLLALIVLLSGAALAQDVQGIPDEYSTIVTTLIGILSAVLVQPLTSIFKKLGRTTGPGTVAISAALSLMVAFFFTFAQASATNTGLNFPGLLLIALIGFLKANGDYITRVFTTAKGAETAGATQGDGAAPALNVTTERPASGLESISGTPRGLFSDLVIPDALLGVILMALRAAGVSDTQANATAIVGRLLPVAPDLLDGNAHLSSENRNRILSEVMTLKASGSLA